MKRNNIQILGLAVGMALSGACAQLQNPPKNGEKLNNIVIGSDQCSKEKLVLPDDSNGMAMIQLLENYATGKSQVMGKAFFLSKPATGVNPYAVIGEADRSVADRKVIAGMKDSLQSVGNRIDILLDEAPANSATADMSTGKKAAEVLQIQRKAMDTSGTAAGTRKISLMQWANLPVGFYRTDYNESLDGSSALPAGSSDGTGTATSNVRSYRSFVVDAKNKSAFSVAIPASPEKTESEGDTTIEGTAGKDIKIMIAGDPNKLTGVDKRLLIVQFQERSDKPKWEATCVMKDDVPPEGKEIAIPTAWGEKQGIAAGDFYLRLVRSYVRRANLPTTAKEGEAPGPQKFIYVDSRSGFQTQGSLAKAK